jgi:hypothetical protein
MAIDATCTPVIVNFLPGLFMSLTWGMMGGILLAQTIERVVEFTKTRTMGGWKVMQSPAGYWVGRLGRNKFVDKDGDYLWKSSEHIWAHSMMTDENQVIIAIAKYENMLLAKRDLLSSIRRPNWSTRVYRAIKALFRKG